MGAIVVGVDGSPGSIEALRWAAGEARLRGASLVLVHAWSAVPLAPLATAPFVVVGGLPELEREVAEQAGKVLEEAVAQVDLAGIEVEHRIERGDAAGAIVEAAKGAELAVLGTRGRGGFAGLLLGSVSHAVAHHATCPVVIVPRQEAD